MTFDTKQFLTVPFIVTHMVETHHYTGRILKHHKANKVANSRAYENFYPKY